MIKINKEDFENFDTIKFLLESIQDETIILGEGVNIPLEQKRVTTCDKIENFRSLLDSPISRKKIIKNHIIRDSFEALKYMCFIMKYHEGTLDKKLAYNAMFFDEGGYRGIISFDYDFFEPVKERRWHLRRLVFNQHNLPSSMIKIFI